MSRGFFLTFEGLDGSGKSTQIRKLAAALEAQGHAVTVTRQPGGTRIGDRIRALLLDSRTESVDPMTELGLMFSDRAQGIAEVIRPALEAGRIVLCDRYTDSTEAYQGGGRQLGSEIVLRMHETMCGGLNPDLTILAAAGIRPLAALGRARERNGRAAKTRAGLSPRIRAFYQPGVRPVPSDCGPGAGAGGRRLRATRRSGRFTSRFSGFWKKAQHRRLAADQPSANPG